MDILGYGEDALTLWALKNKLPAMLEKLDDKSSLSECKALFRPSFGRRGGENKAQFGEFDFILLSKEQLYLGESKWHRSSENINNGLLELREEQRLRHKVFRFYVEEWAFGKYTSWSEFEKAATIKLQTYNIYKPIAPAASLLRANLTTVLDIIKQHFGILPPIKNVLLYLYYGSTTHLPPKSEATDFEVVSIDCSEGVTENFVIL
jgi:hypothetical protein